MAVLGSTVDPRLGAVSPAAIQALSQAGAATGQMYSNLGGSIAGVIQDFKSKKDDSALQEALAAHGSFDEKTGKLTVDRKAFLAAAKKNKVSSKLANAYLKNELEISSMQNEMDIQNKMAGYKGREVEMAEDAQQLRGEMFAFEKEFKTADQRLRISQWASDNLLEMQKLNAQREANEINEDRYKKEYKLALDNYNIKLDELKDKEDLTKAQIKALDAETALKRAETALTDAERLSYEDTDIGLGSEETMSNKLVGVLGIADRATAWDPLSAADKAAFIRDRLDFARRKGANMNSERMKDLQRSYDFFYEDALLKGMPMPETAATIPQNQSLRDMGLSYLDNQTRPYSQSDFYRSPGFYQ